jgi:3-oxoacyl-[acyl-carrier-protein] synthase-1
MTMADENVVVIGVGMMTSVGLSALETASSVRASIMRFTETAWYDRRFEPFIIAEIIEDGLPDLAPALAEETGITNRESRMLRLGTMPLLECLKPIVSSSASPGLVLSLPETETTLPLNRQAFLQRFAQQTEGAFDLDISDCDPKGRAGGLVAIGRASQRIREGTADFMLAGGIDTYRALYLLGTLDLENRVKSSANLDGFIPGEGAGFLLLASRNAAEMAGLAPMALLSPVSEGVEEGHLYSEEPYRGEGLAFTFEKFFQENDIVQPIQEVYSSMNGENYWAKEWGVAVLRNAPDFSPEHGMHHPADCLGDTGAACGPLMVGLATLGMVHGYCRSPCLIYCSSDYGERAVLTVNAP